MKSNEYRKGYKRANLDYSRKGYDFCLKIYEHYTENPINGFAVLEDHVRGYCDGFANIMIQNQWGYVMKADYLKGFRAALMDTEKHGIQFTKQAFNEFTKNPTEYGKGYIKGYEKIKEDEVNKNENII